MRLNGEGSALSLDRSVQVVDRQHHLSASGTHENPTLHVWGNKSFYDTWCFVWFYFTFI